MPAEEVVKIPFSPLAKRGEKTMEFEYKELLESVRKQRPLINCITNNITVNDVANVILACGASPVMASDIREMDDFVGLAKAVVLNVGSISSEASESFEACLKSAQRLCKPVVLDPVGAGAAKYRTDMLFDFLERYPVAVIRGNASEIRTISGESSSTSGVDAADCDAVTAETLEARTAMAANVARRYGCIVAMSGAWDVITDGRENYVCRKGVPMMSQVTGTGCMLTGMTAAFLAANADRPLQAVYAATDYMCLCGEEAFEEMRFRNAGLGTFRCLLIDKISMH